VSESSEPSTSESETSSSSSDNRKKKSTKSVKKPAKKTSSKKDTKSKGKGTKKGDTKKRKSKAKKDPNAPKRATSGYFFYTAARRAELTAEGSTLSMLDKSKQMAAEWGKMTEKQKQPYTALAAKDKERYEKEKANYKPPKRTSSDSSSDSDEPKKKKKKKDPNAPKKNLSAYMFFAASIRPKIVAENSALKPTEILTRIGTEWGKLSAEQKKPYEKQAAADKDRYAKDLSAYNAK